MIEKERLNIDWIEKVSKANRKADKILVEKAIRAFLLLEGLALSDIPFVFKGGTSLMLMTNPNRRLSVDIDIVIPGTIDKFEQDLPGIADKQGFLRMEPQERTATTTVTKHHYKFFYTQIPKTSQAGA